LDGTATEAAAGSPQWGILEEKRHRKIKKKSGIFKFSAFSVVSHVAFRGNAACRDLLGAHVKHGSDGHHMHKFHSESSFT